VNDDEDAAGVQVKSVGNDIGDVIGRYLERERKKCRGRVTSAGRLDDVVEVTSDAVVIIRTRGNCRFRYGVQQQIRVDQIPLTTAV